MPKKPKATEKRAKVEEFFKPSEFKPADGDYTGKHLIINPNRFTPEYRKRKFLVWQAHSGFGCSPIKMGRAVFATCVGDGEDARFDRGDFLYEFTGDVEALKAEA